MQGRINLCFDLGDPKQRMVYEYLRSLGRTKTQTVVEALATPSQSPVHPLPDTDFLLQIKSIVAAECRASVANALSAHSFTPNLCAPEEKTDTQDEPQITETDLQALEVFQSLGLGP